MALFSKVTRRTVAFSPKPRTRSRKPLTGLFLNSTNIKILTKEADYITKYFAACWWYFCSPASVVCYYITLAFYRSGEGGVVIGPGGLVISHAISGLDLSS